MPSLPQISAPVGKSGPGMRSSRSSRLQSGCRTTSVSAAISSRRLCGGTLVAMPTAMPELAVGQQVREARRQHERLEHGAVEVRAEVDRLAVDVAEHLLRERASVALRCSGRRRRNRRRSSRSCPGRPPAGNAARSPAPSAPSSRRPRNRRAGGSASAPHRRRRRSSNSRASRAGLPAASRTGCGGARASDRRARRAARG